MKYLLKDIYLLALIPAIIFSCSNPSDSNQSPDEQPSNGGITLSDMQIEQAGIKTGALPMVTIKKEIECTGVIDVPPNERVMIHSLIAANVVDIKVLPGNTVRKGEIIAIMEHPNIIDLQFEYLSSKSELHKLDTELKRKTELYNSNVTSEKEYQEIKSLHEISMAESQSLINKLNLIGITVESLDRNGISSRIGIRASIAGKIGQVMVNNGEFVEMNRAMFSIISETHKHLELEVFSQDAVNVSGGQMIQFKVPGMESWLNGTVELVNPEVSSSNTVRIHGHITDLESLKIGSFVEAKILIQEYRVTGVSNQELIRQNNKTFLFQYHQSSFVKVFVETGRSDEKFTEILKTDSANKWVLSGNYYLNGI